MEGIRAPNDTEDRCLSRSSYGDDDKSSEDYDDFLEDFEDPFPRTLGRQTKSSRSILPGPSGAVSRGAGASLDSLPDGQEDSALISAFQSSGSALVYLSSGSLDLEDVMFDLDKSERIAASLPKKESLLRLLSKSLDVLGDGPSDITSGVDINRIQSLTERRLDEAPVRPTKTNRSLDMKDLASNSSFDLEKGNELGNRGTVDTDDLDFSYHTDGTSDSLRAEEKREMSVVAVTPETPAQERRRLFFSAADDWIKRKIQYIYLFGMMYAAPICIAVYLPADVVAYFYLGSIGCIVFVNAWMLAELLASFSYTDRQRKLHHARPKVIGKRHLGSIVAAYLPNELTVLIDTVRAIAKTIHELPEGTTLDIVLAHNGGKKEQRIALLEDLRKIEGELPPNVVVHELNVLSSTSKAENVNAALAFFEELGAVRGKEFTQLAMYDADHQPIPEAWRYALETMQDQEAQMVMGRCCVRDGLKYIAVEFDVLYAVAHAGGRCVRGFGFFGGSNGYWDYDTLVATGMDEGMLTEDVDSSFRAQAAGNRMTYDSTIVSYEESPPDFLSLFKQRLRWSQGWYEVTLRQITLPFRRAPGLTLWSRFCIFLILPFRELYVYLSSFTVPIAIVYLTRGCGWDCVDYRLLGLLAFCMQVPISNTLAAWYITKDRTNGIHYRMAGLTPRDYFRYMLISFPYELFKIHVTVMGHARQAMGLNKWVVTKRKTSKDAAAPIYTDAIFQLIDPETLIHQSPYALPARQLFTGTYDEKRIIYFQQDPFVHSAIVVPEGVDPEKAIPCPLTLSRRYSSITISHRSHTNNVLDESIMDIITEAMRTKRPDGRLQDPILEKALTARVLALKELTFYIHMVQFPGTDFIETVGTGSTDLNIVM